MPNCGANLTAARWYSDATIIVTLCLCAVAIEADAQLYKWVDEKGRTQYSDKPPTQQKSQEMKMQAPPPGPVQMPQSAGSTDLSAKAKGSKGPRAGTEGAAPDDAKRLNGDWATAPGARVDVHFVVSYRDGIEVLVGQQWWIGNRSQVDTRRNYTINGSGGNGTMNALDAPSPHTPDLPAKLGYRLDGDMLFLRVSSGEFVGEHTLKRK